MYQGKKISVAMASYNGEKYIREQLESILNQTVPPDEIIVSDDGSTDRTPEIVREVASLENGHIIRFISDNPRHGFAFNFVHAIEHCSGDIIFLCDQDDVWLPEKIEHVGNVFSDNQGVLLVVHDASSINALGAPTEGVTSPFLRSISIQAKTGELLRLPGDPYCEAAASSPEINGMLMALSRDLLTTAFPFPPISSQHDGWLWFCAEAEDKCYFLNEVLTLRRLHSENTSGVGKQGFGRRRLKKIMYRISECNTTGIERFLLSNYMYEYIQSHCSEDNSGAQRALQTILRVKEIGEKEISVNQCGKVTGIFMLVKLFLTDQRYRRSGKKAFFYEFAYILMRSKKQRRKAIQELLS